MAMTLILCNVPGKWWGCPSPNDISGKNLHGEGQIKNCTWADCRCACAPCSCGEAGLKPRESIWPPEGTARPAESGVRGALGGCWLRRAGAAGAPHQLTGLHGMVLHMQF